MLVNIICFALGACFGMTLLAMLIILNQPPQPPRALLGEKNE